MGEFFLRKLSSAGRYFSELVHGTSSYLKVGNVGQKAVKFLILRHLRVNFFLDSMFSIVDLKFPQKHKFSWKFDYSFFFLAFTA